MLLESEDVERDMARDSDATPGALSIEREGELKEEIRFLRGLVEQRDRDAAELRAALREALKIAPRQLNAAATSPDAPQTATNGQQRPQNTPMVNDGAHASNGAQIEADGEETSLPTTYAALADWIEKMNR